LCITDYSDEDLAASDNPFAVVLINNYVQFKKPENNRIFSEETDKKTGKTNTMGILEQLIEIKSQEAMEKGLEEGNKKAVKAYLNNTEFSVEKIASLVDVPVSFVEQLKESLRKK